MGNGVVAVRNSDLHGLGLFAENSVRAGDPLLSCPLLILSPEDTRHIKPTRIYRYAFHVSGVDANDPEQSVAVAFGDISMCNHSSEANATFRVDAGARQVHLTASKDIPAGSEILIDYDEPEFLSEF